MYNTNRWLMETYIQNNTHFIDYEIKLNRYNPTIRN